MVTVAQRAPSTEGLLEPGAPMWAHRFAQRLVSLFKLVWPIEPARMWIVKKADLPPAAAWKGGVVVVSDATGGPSLAFSDGTTWLKVTMGGPV